MSELATAYDVLNNIYKNGAYSNLQLSKVLSGQENPRTITKIVYGVLDNNIRYDYYIAQLCSKKPQTSVAILLKMGMYCLSEMDSMPDYSVVDNCVSLCDEIKKYQLKGFVNATLKNFCTAKIAMPKDKIKYLSIKTSTPTWLAKEISKQYGYDNAMNILSSSARTQEHVRHNDRKISYDGLKNLLIEKGIDFEESSCGGFFVYNSRDIKQLFDLGLLTMQSMTSVECCKMIGVKKGDVTLDLCAAPGGKSILINEIARDSVVIACDIYEHRLKLIQSYIDRMGAINISLMLSDATKLKEEWIEKFDNVLCDVPCSGLGVAAKKPDIYLNASMDKVEELSKIQYKILETASNYVKKDGLLVYSTCTILRQENYNVVGRFVKENKDWKIVEHKQFLPDEKGFDGFFVAKLKRAEVD